MFSNSSKVTAACVVAMMMMMMMMMMKTTEATPAPKHSVSTHRRSSDGSAGKMFLLQFDNKISSSTRNVRPLESASISPWTYNVTQDHSLYPQTLYEAHCLYEGCLDQTGQVDLNLQSRPIMREVLLLRKVRSPGAETHHFRLESRLVAVGCTCVRPAVQRQQ